MSNKVTKEEIIKDIKLLISTADEELVDINPSFLNYFELSELIDMRDKLVQKKKTIRNDTFDYLDEIYEKTKEDSI